MVACSLEEWELWVVWEECKCLVEQVLVEQVQVVLEE